MTTVSGMIRPQESMAARVARRTCRLRCRRTRKCWAYLRSFEAGANRQRRSILICLILTTLESLEVTLDHLADLPRIPFGDELVDRFWGWEEAEVAFDSVSE